MAETQRFDIAIIGAGIAGSALAAALGLAVLLQILLKLAKLRQLGLGGHPVLAQRAHAPLDAIPLAPILNIDDFQAERNALTNAVLGEKFKARHANPVGEHDPAGRGRDDRLVDGGQERLDLVEAELLICCPYREHTTFFYTECLESGAEQSMNALVLLI